ncbi:hypothetical protein BJX99DRAFT_62220 [Aspergillus californicus]
MSSPLVVDGVVVLVAHGEVFLASILRCSSLDAIHIPTDAGMRLSNRLRELSYLRRESEYLDNHLNFRRQAGSSHRGPPITTLQMLIGPVNFRKTPSGSGETGEDEKGIALAFVSASSIAPFATLLRSNLQRPNASPPLLHVSGR